MDPFWEHLLDLRDAARTADGRAALQEFEAAYQGMNSQPAMQHAAATGRLRPDRARPSEDEIRAGTEKFEADLIALDELRKAFLRLEEVDSDASVAGLRRMTALLRHVEAEDAETLRVLLERHGY